MNFIGQAIGSMLGMALKYTFEASGIKDSLKELVEHDKKQSEKLKMETQKMREFDGKIGNWARWVP